MNSQLVDATIENAEVVIELSLENIGQLIIAQQEAVTDLLSDEAWDAYHQSFEYEPYMTVTVNNNESRWEIWSITATDGRIAGVLLCNFGQADEDQLIPMVAMFPGMRTVDPRVVVPQRVLRVRNFEDIDQADAGVLYRYFRG